MRLLTLVLIFQICFVFLGTLQVMVAIVALSIWEWKGTSV
jgi:hypothetical protein